MSKMPPLPHPVTNMYVGDDTEDVFTADQMSAYAKEYAAAQNADLLARLSAAEADAERYQFLRDDFSPMGLNIDGNHAWAYRRNATLKGPNLDAAIDAARSKA